jgi:hypothetical protein
MALGSSLGRNSWILGMRVVTTLVLCLLAVGLWAVVSRQSDAPVPASPSSESDDALPSATGDWPAGANPARQLVTPPADHPISPHILVLEDEHSAPLPGRTVVLWAEAWSTKVQTDDSGEALVPQDAPRFVNVSVPVPLFLTQPVTFEVVPGGTTRVVVQATIDIIMGIVHDPQGHAVEGVAVCGSKLAVVTAADGSFCMPRYDESPSDGESLYCSKDGYQPLQAALIAWGSRGVTLTLAPLATVDLSVRRISDGTPVRRFFAQRGHVEGDRVQWSKKVYNNGHDSIQLADLLDGRNTVRVWPGTTADWGATSIDLEVFAGMRALRARVDVPPSQHFEVTVLDERGHPIDDAFVALEEWQGIGAPPAEVVSDASRHRWRETNASLTDPDGKTTLTGGADGSYIRVEKAGYCPARLRVSRLANRSAITLHPLLRGSVVGTESVVRILRACNWASISIEFISTATTSSVATGWHEGGNTAEVPPGDYLVVAAGIVQGDRSVLRCSVGLGRFSVDRTGWTLNVDAMRNEWLFGVVRAQVVCDSVPVANKTIRLKPMMPREGRPTSAAPVFVTDEFGAACFVADAGQYSVVMTSDRQRSGTLSVPGQGNEVSNALVVLR